MLQRSMHLSSWLSLARSELVYGEKGVVCVSWEHSLADFEFGFSHLPLLPILGMMDAYEDGIEVSAHPETPHKFLGNFKFVH